MAVLVDIKFLVHVSAEYTRAEIAAPGAPSSQHLALNIPEAAQHFTQMNKTKVQATAATADGCRDAAREVAKTTLPSAWSVGDRPFLPDHIFHIDGWETPIGAQFGYAFPIMQEIPGGGTQALVRTLKVIASNGVEQQLLARFLIQVQASG